MHFLRTASVLMLLGAATVTWAQAPADFGGTWALNTKKGENLGMVAALTETLAVTQTSGKLTLDFTDVFQGKTSTRQVTYDLSGAPVENFAAMGDPSKTVSRWEDQQLVTTWTSEGAIAGTEVVRTETRALSGEGKIMTVETLRGDNPPMILVYEKQE
jgi:hypothetical protein